MSFGPPPCATPKGMPCTLVTKASNWISSIIYSNILMHIIELLKPKNKTLILKSKLLSFFKMKNVVTFDL